MIRLLANILMDRPRDYDDPGVRQYTACSAARWASL